MKHKLLQQRQFHLTINGSVLSVISLLVFGPCCCSILFVCLHFFIHLAYYYSCLRLGNRLRRKSSKFVMCLVCDGTCHRYQSHAGCKWRHVQHLLYKLLGNQLYKKLVYFRYIFVASEGILTYIK